ncbi:MAG: cobyrinic acid a,c-diamide synthase [Methylophilaceae bacterium 17-44-8]|nr:MAG: cobyrinic acid a,c-diamide synthase [Methylophilales bacterium 28-44-11]OZA05905.1 MAG: cobyrinic acid a,c-diamide synthase [Methylophilaceae bacterium 17-44-8]
MKHILVANAKGGSGKTTLATNLAGYLATQSNHVLLADLDRQQSSTQWLHRRPADAPIIHTSQHKPSHAIEWVVTDSPAGLRDEKLAEAVKEADLVIVPIQPSAFDIGAAADFLEVLMTEKAIRKNKTFVALVGSRVNSRTNAAMGLATFMNESGFPVLAYLRNSQVYTTAAEQGLSIFDMRPSVVAQDIEQWSVLLDWIKDTHVK